MHYCVSVNYFEAVNCYYKRFALGSSVGMNTESETKVPLWDEESIPGTESGIE